MCFNFYGVASVFCVPCQEKCHWLNTMWWWSLFLESESFPPGARDNSEWPPLLHPLLPSPGVTVYFFPSLISDHLPIRAVALGGYVQPCSLVAVLASKYSSYTSSFTPPPSPGRQQPLKWLGWRWRRRKSWWGYLWAHRNNRAPQPHRWVSWTWRKGWVGRGHPHESGTYGVPGSWGNTLIRIGGSAHCGSTTYIQTEVCQM